MTSEINRELILGKQNASRERKPDMQILKQGEVWDWLFRGTEKKPVMGGAERAEGQVVKSEVREL